jgi:nucleoside-diphosphate-sugar epimerase
MLVGDRKSWRNVLALYLVTGGCGFIGSHLCEALVARGDRVRILDDLSTGKLENKPPAAELIRGDVADPVAVRTAMEGADGCFHLAAIASVERGNQDWLGTHRTNLTGAITILDAARRAGAGKPIPVVYASSAAVYGDNPEVPLAETATVRPLSAYGADKLGCELHARVASHVHGVPTVGMRFFNVFGPRQDPKSPYSGVISIFCDRLRAGQGIAITATAGRLATSSMSAMSSRRFSRRYVSCRKAARSSTSAPVAKARSSTSPTPLPGFAGARRRSTSSRRAPERSGSRSAIRTGLRRCSGCGRLPI